MQMKMPAVLVIALALAAPGATSFAKDKGKDKDKGKGRSSESGGRDDDGGRRGDGSHDDDRDHDRRDGKITICHVPPGNPSNRRTLSVGESAWSAHQGHGDYRGPCRRGNGHPSPSPNGDFERYDRNRNGVISADEWPGDAGTFDRLDVDNDGVISRREFRRY